MKFLRFCSRSSWQIQLFSPLAYCDLQPLFCVLKWRKTILFSAR